MKRNKTLASCAKYKTPMQMNYSSPAKATGQDALAESQARLNNQEYQKRLKENIEEEDEGIKKGKINVITGTPL